MKYSEFFNHRRNTFIKSYQFITEHIDKNNCYNIIELGTTRSFCSGVIESRPEYFNPNTPSNWDWGAGLFTKVFSENLKDYNMKLYTVDPDNIAISVSKYICNSLDGSNNIEFINDYSTNYLQQIDFKIDFLYMDHMESSEEACLKHLEDAKIIVERDLMNQKGIILIDDVNYPHYIFSKGKYSVPYFLDNGYNLLLGEYQCILQKE